MNKSPGIYLIPGLLKIPAACAAGIVVLMRLWQEQHFFEWRLTAVRA